MSDGVAPILPPELTQPGGAGRAGRGGRLELICETQPEERVVARQPGSQSTLF